MKLGAVHGIKFTSTILFSSSKSRFSASDGTKKLKAMLPTHFAPEINSGNLQNLGLIRILDYTLNVIPNQPEKALIVVKCEVVSPSLDKEIEVKKEEHGIIPKPKQDFAPKSAAQIVLEHRGKNKSKERERERERPDKLLEENRRKVEEAQMRIALELQQIELERYEELEQLQRQMEEVVRRNKIEEKANQLMLLVKNKPRSKVSFWFGCAICFCWPQCLQIVSDYQLFWFL